MTRIDLIDGCPNLKVIGKGGVGLNNVDVDHALSKDIKVLNTRLDLVSEMLKG